jgi:hypothetical protein
MQFMESDRREADEQSLRRTLEEAQRRYAIAPPSERREAKEQLLNALSKFSAFACSRNNC